MQPTMNMDTSSKTLNTQASLKSKEIEEIIFNDYHYNEKTWSKWPTAPYTTTVVEGVIVSIMDCSQFYSCKRIGNTKFQVNYLDSMTGEDELFNEYFDNTKIMTAPIPLFSRDHIVCVDEYGVMFCDCHSFECTGFFCVHMVCVAEFVAKSNHEKFEGFTHRDIAVRWTSAYMQLAFRHTTPKSIQIMYNQLSKNDVKGPKLQHPICDCIEIEEYIEPLPAEKRVKNYHLDDLALDFIEPFDGYETTFIEPDGYSQKLEQFFSDSIEDSAFPDKMKMMQDMH